MTRNFEEEYKKFAETNVPDLWSRIEAAIDEKKEEVLPEKTADTVKKTNKVTVFTARYAWILAACACLLLTFGALRMIGRSKGQASAEYASEAASASYEEDAESPAYDAAADTMVSEAADAAASETADTTASEAADMTANEAADEMVSEAATSDDVKKTAGNDEVAQEVTDADEEEELADEVIAMAPPATNSAAESTNSAGESMVVVDDHENLIITCRIEDISGFEKNNIIKVTVTDPLDTDLEKGSVIKVFVAGDLKDEASNVFTRNRNDVYTMTLKPGSNDDYEFVSAQIK